MKDLKLTQDLFNRIEIKRNKAIIEGYDINSIKYSENELINQFNTLFSYKLKSKDIKINSYHPYKFTLDDSKANKLIIEQYNLAKKFNNDKEYYDRNKLFIEFKLIFLKWLGLGTSIVLSLGAIASFIWFVVNKLKATLINIFHNIINLLGGLFLSLWGPVIISIVIFIGLNKLMINRVTNLQLKEFKDNKPFLIFIEIMLLLSSIFIAHFIKFCNGIPPSLESGKDVIKVIMLLMGSIISGVIIYLACKK